MPLPNIPDSKAKSEASTQLTEQQKAQQRREMLAIESASACGLTVEEMASIGFTPEHIHKAMLEMLRGIQETLIENAKRLQIANDNVQCLSQKLPPQTQMGLVFSVQASCIGNFNAGVPLTTVSTKVHKIPR